MFESNYPHNKEETYNPSAYHCPNRPNQTSVIWYENDRRGLCLTEITQETKTSNDAYAYYSPQYNCCPKQEPEDIKQEGPSTGYENPQIRRNSSIIQYNHARSPYYKNHPEQTETASWTHSGSARHSSSTCTTPLQQYASVIKRHIEASAEKGRLHSIVNFRQAEIPRQLIDTTAVQNSNNVFFFSSLSGIY